MRFPHHARVSVTRRGEKERRLAAFIARGLEGLAAPAQPPGSQAAQGGIQVIARSPQSPVVKSVVARARDIAAAGCVVRVILMRPDLVSADLALEQPGPAVGLAALQTCELRFARNPRLIEAHEQLVIAARFCWVGDTMRRDPATCDAYESYVEDSVEIAAAAAATFGRLWGDCEPLAADAAPAATLAPPKETLPASLLARRT
jgi:hypothetical protein